MIRRKENQANALVELVILLPLYVLILLGLIYIGDLSGIRTRLQPAVEQAAARTETVTAADVEKEMFSLYPEGELTLLEKQGKQSFPPPGEMRRIIDYLADPPERPWASGSWEFRNGRLVPVIHTGMWRRAAELEKKHLEEMKPELIESTLQDYMNEVEARAHFSYDAGYIRIGPVELSRMGELDAEHRAFARGDRERRVAGGGYNHPIEELLAEMGAGQPLPDYPDFMTYRRELWWPDLEKPKK